MSGLLGVYAHWGGVEGMFLSVGLGLAGRVAREAAFRAYEKEGFALVASDAVKEIGSVGKDWFY